MNILSAMTIKQERGWGGGFCGKTEYENTGTSYGMGRFSKKSSINVSSYYHENGVHRIQS